MLNVGCRGSARPRPLLTAEMPFGSRGVGQLRRCGAQSPLCFLPGVCFWFTFLGARFTPAASHGLAVSVCPALELCSVVTRTPEVTLTGRVHE